jgi:hypothetical protein
MKKHGIISTMIITFLAIPLFVQAQLNHPPAPDWTFDHSDFYHRIGQSFMEYNGRSIVTGWETTHGERGLLQDGPFKTFPAGKKMLKYQLEGRISQGQEIFIDVLSWRPDTYAYKVLARRIIRNLDQGDPELLCFDVASDKEYLQFRVASWGSNVRIYDDIGLYQGDIVGNHSEDPGILYRYNAAALYHRVGAAHPLGGWYADDATPSGFLAFGPYVSLDTLGGEQLAAAFELTAKRYANHPDDLIAYIDVCTEYGRNILASRYITRHEFAVNMQKQTFTLKIPAPHFSYDNLELRVYHINQPDSFLKLDDVYVFSTGPVPVGIRR